MASRPSYAAIAHRESFKHENLKLSENSIRLFQVQAGGRDEPISIRITQYALHRRPEYKAISYTWGSAVDSQPILVNGRTFSVHPNLWHLLSNLRARRESSFLWADRMCIDQDNLAERNFHVQLMGKIYDQAASVIVWLGLPAADNTELRAMNFIKEIAVYRKTRGDVSFEQVFLSHDNEHRWETLLRMCKHHYWGRTWIIQEFLRATQIEALCKHTSLNWDDFEDLIKVMDQPQYRCRSVISEILKSRPVRLTLRRRAKDATTLHELLSEYHDSRCTERRDKVYGILGLASDCGEDDAGTPRGVKPDYKKHVVQVYLDAMRCIDASLPLKSQVAATVNLVRKSLWLTDADIKEYLNSTPLAVEQLPVLTVVPGYVGIVQNAVSSWTSASDLRQRLHGLDWGEFVGYEMRSARPGMGRRSSTRAVHSALPSDLIQNVINAAELEPEIANLHNYPQIDWDGLRVPSAHLALTAHEKQQFQNSSMQKPTIIVEQPVGQDMVRLGFACTNVRRGDFLLQFSGLDNALIVRRLGVDMILVGKAVVFKHAGLGDQETDALIENSPWYSACPKDIDCELFNLRCDALSLAELLNRD